MIEKKTSPRPEVESNLHRSRRQLDPAQPSPDDKPLEAVAPKPPLGATKEIGGPSGPEPTRYGDWERKGRCVDF